MEQKIKYTEEELCQYKYLAVGMGAALLQEFEEAS
jgi:hypothetical protein